MKITELESLEVRFHEVATELEKKKIEVKEIKRNLSSQKRTHSISDIEKTRLMTLENDFKKMRNKAEIAVKEAEQFRLKYNDAMK